MNKKYHKVPEDWINNQVIHNKEHRWAFQTIRDTFPSCEINKQEWVSVKDEKPDFGVCVLTYPGYRSLPFGIGYGDEPFGDDKDFNFWEWNDKIEDGQLVKNITHWMPLPKKP